MSNLSQCGWIKGVKCIGSLQQFMQAKSIGKGDFMGGNSAFWSNCTTPLVTCRGL